MPRVSPKVPAPGTRTPTAADEQVRACLANGRAYAAGLDEAPATAAREALAACEHGSLNDLVAARAGDDKNLAGALASGRLAVSPPPSSEERGPWRLRLDLKVANDNWATLFDGKIRSDDGATATESLGLAMSRRTATGGEETFELNASHA